MPCPVAWTFRLPSSAPPRCDGFWPVGRILHSQFNKRNQYMAPFPELSIFLHLALLRACCANAFVTIDAVPSTPSLMAAIFYGQTDLVCKYLDSGIALWTDFQEGFGDFDTCLINKYHRLLKNRPAGVWSPVCEFFVTCAPFRFST